MRERIMAMSRRPGIAKERWSLCAVPLALLAPECKTSEHSDLTKSQPPALVASARAASVDADSPPADAARAVAPAPVDPQPNEFDFERRYRVDPSLDAELERFEDRNSRYVTL